MNVIVLDKAQPGIKEALAGCKVGEPKELTITVTPTADDENTFVASVDAVSYAEGEEEPVEESPPSKPKEAPYKPKKKGETPPMGMM